jgi:bifunctional DNase/RNase
MPEVEINSIRVSLMTYQRVVILKEKNADRYLPIWIGPSEADAIAVKLRDVDVPRPLTHDLIQLVISSLGAGLTYVTVYGLQNDTFFAKLGLQIDGRTLEVDSRPSDALALAVRADVPIYVLDEVLDMAGVALDDDGSPLISEEPEGQQKSAQVLEEELRGMSAFTDFINTLDLEDLGKDTSKDIGV